jgi:CRP/FNR family transcriptional regulator
VTEIEQAEFFRALQPEQFARVKPLVREKVFERQRVIYFEGAPAERLWVVRQGEVRLYKSSSNGQITTLDVLGPGEVFGAVSAIERDAYSASAETVTGGSAWWLGREVFLRLLNDDPRLAREILRIVSRRLQDAHDRLRSLAHDPAPTRVALALLRAANGSDARVTRRALAEAAGTSVETAIRIVRRFEVACIVQGSVGRVKILDKAALQKIAGHPSE